MNKTIIAIEGIDGAGKSSTIDFLVSKFKKQIVVYERTKKSAIIDRIVSCDFMQKHYMFQIPIYLFLSHWNYFKYKSLLKKQTVIIMDRCFLSNICYFFPNALNNKKVFKIVMFFEPKIKPNKIFIFDETPKIAQHRDLYKKDLQWLIETREAYLNSVFSDNLNKYDLEILDSNMSLKTKTHIISDYVKEVIRNGS